MAESSGVESTVGEGSSGQETGNILYCNKKLGKGGYRGGLVM